MCHGPTGSPVRRARASAAWRRPGSGADFPLVGQRPLCLPLARRMKAAGLRDSRLNTDSLIAGFGGRRSLGPAQAGGAGWRLCFGGEGCRSWSVFGVVGLGLWVGVVGRGLQLEAEDVV